MFTQIYSKIKVLCNKYKDAFLIKGGDFNDAANDSIDRFPERIFTKSTIQGHNLSEKLSVTDAWRFFNPSSKEFTWCNTRCTQQSRIDLWFN